MVSKSMMAGWPAVLAGIQAQIDVVRLTFAGGVSVIGGVGSIAPAPSLSWSKRVQNRTQHSNKRPENDFDSGKKVAKSQTDSRVYFQPS
jgi:hypothetical protein